MLAQGVARLSFQKRSWGCKNQNRLSGGRSYTSFERADLDEELLSVRPISGLKPKKSLKRVMPTVEVAQITQKGALKVHISIFWETFWLGTPGSPLGVQLV